MGRELNSVLHRPTRILCALRLPTVRVKSSNTELTKSYSV